MARPKIYTPNDYVAKEVVHNLYMYCIPKNPWRMLKWKQYTIPEDKQKEILYKYFNDKYYPWCHNSILNPLIHSFFRAGIVIQNTYQIPIYLWRGNSKWEIQREIIQGYIPAKPAWWTKKQYPVLFKPWMIVWLSTDIIANLTVCSAYTNTVIRKIQNDTLYKHILHNKKKYLALLDKMNITYIQLHVLPQSI